MKCPHCLVVFHAEFSTPSIMISESKILTDNQGSWSCKVTVCPDCNESSIFLRVSTGWDEEREWLVWPRGISRSPLSPDIPAKFTADYREACLVLADSPKSSAALSRRCLQHLLREKAKVKERDLSKEIQEVLDSRTLPSHLSEAIDAIRNYGNFAAHPLKSTNTGEILDVEPGEAEWTLDVLEQLFDFYFVGPALLTAKRNALNKKLAEAGKPLMK